MLGGSSQLDSVVSNYGDRASPRPGTPGTPYDINGGDPNYLPNGLILQVGDDGDDDGDIWTCRRMLKVVWSQNLVHSGNLT